jgi:hypothetical protein
MLTGACISTVREDHHRHLERMVYYELINTGFQAFTVGVSQMGVF